MSLSALLLALALAQATAPASVQGAASNVVAVRSVEGAGSGFPVGEDLVVTALHVMGSRTGAQLRLQDGTIVGGQVVSVSETEDLALIRTEQPLFDPMRLAPASPSPGDEVWALGDLPDDGHGVLILDGRVIADSDPADRYLPFLAGVQHGFSGGPLVDEQGEVVGVIDARSGDGESLAIHADAVAALIGKGHSTEDSRGAGPWPWVVGASLLGFAALAVRRRSSRRRPVVIRLGPVREAGVTSQMEER